ncbi:MAG TPA: hypothetical protein VGL91_13005 [Acidobacteriota bacterium]|jgi:hypothetical protein
MSRRLIIESSEQGRREIDYSSLSLREIDRRVKAYEKKYRTSFARHSKQFSCSDASPLEMTDIMDWEYLEQEKKERWLARREEKNIRLQ